MKTAELTGVALDWAVAKCEGVDYETADGSYMEDDENDDYYGCTFNTPYSPSTNWATGGPIIEREKLGVVPHGFTYKSSNMNNTLLGFGDTFLVAAMRCYVVSKLGGEIEIPKELT